MDGTRIPLGSMRRGIMRTVSKAKQEIPHFYLWTEVILDELLSFRSRLPKEVRPSLTAYAVWAAARALRAHPGVNASFADDAVIRHEDVNIGVAVALDEGLLVPVIRMADTKQVLEITRELEELAARARARRLSPEAYRGGTFTISNLGMFNIQGFTAVIQPPEAGIMAIGSAQARWRKGPDGWGERTVVEVALSVDHRIVDGAPAAAFLSDFARTLGTARHSEAQAPS